MEKQLKITVKDGLDASGIAQCVQTANQFQSSLYLKIDENHRVNAKSIMGMMSFLAGNHQEVIVDAQGADAEAAIRALASCLTGKE